MSTQTHDQTLIPSKLAVAHELRTKIAELQTEHDTLTGWLTAHYQRDKSAPGQADSPAHAARAAYINDLILTTRDSIDDVNAQLVSAQTLEVLV
jgi:hypothetical protein